MVGNSVVGFQFAIELDRATGGRYRDVVIAGTPVQRHRWAARDPRSIAESRTQGSRPHLSLDRTSPTPRAVEAPSLGEVLSIPQVGGLH